MFTGSRGSGLHLHLHLHLHVRHPPYQLLLAPSCPWRRNIVTIPFTAASAAKDFLHRKIVSTSSGDAGGVGLGFGQKEGEEEDHSLKLRHEEAEEDNTGSNSRQLRRSADWKAARAYRDNGVVYEGRIESFNNGGLLIRFYSLLGFLPYPLLSPCHSQKEPQKSIQNIAKGLVGTFINVKVVHISEEDKKLIFSEKDAVWSKYSTQVEVGDVFDGRVASVEDYGAFIDLCFPDGYYYVTGLVHVSEVSWDLVQDMRDVLTIGDEVKVKVTQIDREKARITLSIKQLENDPLLERLDEVIPQEKGQSESEFQDLSNHLNIEALPGLESICRELLQEDGISDIKIGRQGLEKRVVSQDLELWLSNVQARDKRFTLLARAGRQVQEVHLTTALDQDGVKRAVQRVLGRVP